MSTQHPSCKFDVHTDKRSNHWEVTIKFWLNGQHFPIRIKSHKWSLTGKWMPAKVVSDLEITYITKEEMVEVVEVLALAAKYAIDMDSEHKFNMGPTSI